MEKESLKKFPIEFQKINKVARQQNTKEDKRSFININFYQSPKMTPHAFYKPISKIIKFNV